MVESRHNQTSYSTGTKEVKCTDRHVLLVHDFRSRDQARVNFEAPEERFQFRKGDRRAEENRYAEQVCTLWGYRLC